MKLLYCIGFTLFIIGVSCEELEFVHTVQYTSQNFDNELESKNNFVMFYAPWCGHCKRLAPIWEQLGEMLSEEANTMRVARVNCVEESILCSDQDITGYPTLKFFKPGDKEGVRYRGSRDLPSLTNFINEQLRTEPAEPAKPLPTPAVMIELHEDTFDKFIATGRHFIKFYAPWCGHCQKLAPVWAKLGQAMDSEEAVTLSKVDCTQEKSICSLFDIKGYPTLLWIEDGRRIDKYQGERTLEDLKEYISNKLKTHEPVLEPEIIEPETNNVEELNGDTFEEGVSKVFSLVMYYAPWCGHCKRMAPDWEELGHRFSKTNMVYIYKVDCTLDVNKKLCHDQQVEGFPSVFVYEEGQKTHEYNGNRGVEDMYDFILKKLPKDEL